MLEICAQREKVAGFFWCFTMNSSSSRRLISAWNVAISPHFAIPYLEVCQVVELLWGEALY